MSEVTNASGGELLPCPFCGGEAALDYSDEEGSLNWVECTRCGAAVHKCSYSSRELLVAAWNRRTDS